MAVAVKNIQESKTKGVLNRLAIPSLVGLVYLISSLSIVFKLIPYLWNQFVGNSGGTFASAVLMGSAMIAAAIALAIMGGRILGNNPLHGLRAGIFTSFAGLLVATLLSRWASLWIEHGVYHQGLFGQTGQTTGILLASVVALALLGGFLFWFFSRNCEQFLKAFEDQGWFSSESYKKNQGSKVRRGTILGLMLIFGSGIYTLINHDTLGKDASDWRLNVPFTGTQYVPANTSVKYMDGDKEVTKNIPGDVGDCPLAGTQTRPSISSFQKQMDRKADQIVVPISTALDGIDLNYELNLPVDYYGKLPRKITGEAKRDFYVVDRYKLRDLNSKIDPAVYTKISNPAKIPGTIQNLEGQESDLAEMDGKLVTKTAFADARDAASKDGKPFPEGVPPEKADGKTQFAGITLLPQVKYTIPLLLLGLTSWFAWRLVNLPVFADFLIATEAELNKVSWTTRKRLFQDTMVVLTTVFLMSGYLFLMDQVWAHLLSSWPINVIVINPEKAKAPDAEGKW